jgi:hypothetical protein
MLAHCCMVVLLSNSVEMLEFIGGSCEPSITFYTQGVSIKLVNKNVIRVLNGVLEDEDMVVSLYIAFNNSDGKT